jgi:hypothetical protein
MRTAPRTLPRSLTSVNTSGEISPLEIGFTRRTHGTSLQQSSAKKESSKNSYTSSSTKLNGMRAAAKALGDSAGKEIKVAKKRVLSAAGRAATIKAAKKRWPKVKRTKRQD